MFDSLRYLILIPCHDSEQYNKTHIAALGYAPFFNNHVPPPITQVWKGQKPERAKTFHPIYSDSVKWERILVQDESVYWSAPKIFWSCSEHFPNPSDRIRKLSRKITANANGWSPEKSRTSTRLFQNLPVWWAKWIQKWTATSIG